MRDSNPPDHWWFGMLRNLGGATVSRQVNKRTRGLSAKRETCGPVDRLGYADAEDVSTHTRTSAAPPFGGPSFRCHASAAPRMIAVR